LRFLFVLVAAAVGVTFAPAMARAQSVASINPTRLTGSPVPTRPENQDPLGVSYSDCTADMTLQFPVTLSGFTGNASLEVWGSLGSDCVNPADRGVGNAATAVCWAVSASVTDPVVAQGTIPVNVRVQDLVGWQGSLPTQPSSPPAKGAEACTAQAGYAAVPMNISFLAIDSQGNSVGVPYLYSIQTDLVGPPAPTVCESVGDTVFNLTWTPNTDTDTVGYVVYLDPVPGTEPDGGMPGPGAMPPDAGACGSPLSTTTCGDTMLAGAILADAGADAATPIEAGTTTGDDAGAEAGVENGSGGISTVPTTYQYKATSGITITDKSVGQYAIDGLVDYVTYTAAVAAVDGMGNIGPPSAEVCDYPAPIQDFWQVYENDGGGKGGFCALQTVGVGGSSLAGVAGVLVFAAVARRRRRR
jgi:hypothetical protein